jgi:hypothetical protein
MPTQLLCTVRAPYPLMRSRAPPISNSKYTCCCFMWGSVRYILFRTCSRNSLRFVWLISRQLTVLFSQSKPGTSHQPIILLSRNKSAPDKRTRANGLCDYPLLSLFWFLPSSIPGDVDWTGSCGALASGFHLDCQLSSLARSCTCSPCVPASARSCSKSDGEIVSFSFKYPPQ